MLAAAPQDVPLREHSHLDLQHSNQPLEDRLCPGCKKSVVNEQGGLVVAFGQSFFHVDCFKCAKCRNQVTADTNLLLLSDGSPICANCSYSCNICHLPILDEAIMTGDDSYHAHCFKCKVCSNRIDELVFAKTSQGIYCMNCHNERMIKIRKHAQKKAERERANGGSGSSRSRDHDARNFHRDHDKHAPEDPSRSISRSHSNLAAASAPTDNSYRAPAKPVHGPYVNDVSMPPSYSQSPAPPKPRATAPLPVTPSRSPSVTIAPPDPKDITNSYYHPDLNAHGLHKSNTLPIPPSSPMDAKRRSSYDDGVRPLNILVKQPDSLSPDNSNYLRGSSGSATEGGLSVTPRRDKRRSINPGLSLPAFKDDTPTQQPANIPPRNASLTAHEQNGSPYLSTHDQSSQITFTTSRPPSRSDSVHSTHLDAERNLSRSSSFRSHQYDDSQDDTIIMSPPSMSMPLGDDPEPPSTSKTIKTRHTRDSAGHRGSATLSPTDTNGFHHSQRRGSASSSYERHGGPSRSASPAYRADVPHGVESGTDTEPENEPDNQSIEGHEPHPPAPPPKDSTKSTRSSTATIADASFDTDASDTSQMGDMSDSEPVERTTRTTYIAPALPPIRFSVNADFGDMLSSTLMKSLGENTAKSPSSVETPQPKTPPPTASLFGSHNQDSTPTNGVGASQSPPANNSSLADVLEELDADERRASATAQSSPPPAQNGVRLVTSEPSEPTPTLVLPTSRRTEPDPELLIMKLREELNFSKENGALHVKVDVNVAETIIAHLEARNKDYTRLKNKVDGLNRESKLYVDGISVAQAEYDREIKARRDAEAEVTRLRVLLSGQAARLTTLSGDNRRQELREKMSKDLHENLSGLEHDLSRLKVERDLTLAEVEELTSKRSTGHAADLGVTNLGRSLTKRLENIRNEYQRELIPLNEQKEALKREISELKGVRDVFLEETTVLNARNEELAQLNAVYAHRIENAPPPETPSKSSQDDGTRSQQSHSSHSQPSASSLIAPPLSTSTSASSTVYDENQESKLRAPRPDNELLITPAKGKFKWPGMKKDMANSPASIAEMNRGKAHIEHNFQQTSVLRFTRCDHCGDTLWGSQLRCAVCSTSIHVRCIANVAIPCTQHQPPPTAVRAESPPAALPPSMFGRELIEQVEADSKGEERQVPVIVEKCIDAVEARALEYEGIYRKTGGSGQTKAITQMFERGDYNSFDLRDSDRFNDICSITSVLKTYFRSLPIPLLTFDLHDQFMAAIAIKDPALKQQSLIDLIDKLPNEHYYTLRMLMLHLNRVRQCCETNLMNGRNLGVVFGPTLLRSRDPGAEFSDMAGKALFVEWLVDNAPLVFTE
ncbi:RhoGAP-domain-containing protein [Pholiota conissans]|uniref:RhoGAP-domain-containing protein n=1 Tax=Pholiota conissans TaxID=109636 RepID=A0A9P5YZK8_9AGAR|nr:RhoGAP-domain-containing protein [Pholiota conissans]